MQLKKYVRPVLGGGAAVLGILVFVFIGLPLGLPFLLAWLLSAAAEPAVAALGRRTKLPRAVRSAACMTALFLILGAVLWFFLRILWQELRLFVLRLPALLQGLQEPMARLRLGLEAMADRTPPEFAGVLRSRIANLFTGSSLVLSTLSQKLTGLISALLAKLPGLLVGLVTTVVAAYMLSAALPEVKAWVRGRLREPWLSRIRRFRGHIRRALGGWVRAQLKLMGVIFLLLSLGLWLLGEDFALLFAGIIAVLDALPVLGTGTVLIPWALFSFLRGVPGKGFGLLILYVVCSFTRSALEPRLVGRQLGLHPLLTLMAFYAGFRLLGVAGMLLGPILAILAKHLISGAEPRPADG